MRIEVSHSSNLERIYSRFFVFVFDLPSLKYSTSSAGYSPKWLAQSWALSISTWTSRKGFSERIWISFDFLVAKCLNEVDCGFIFWKKANESSMCEIHIKAKTKDPLLLLLLLIIVVVVAGLIGFRRVIFLICFCCVPFFIIMGFSS